MFYFWMTLLLLLNTVWLILVPFALPGNWLIVITTSLFAWWQWENGVFSIFTLSKIENQKWKIENVILGDTMDDLRLTVTVAAFWP